MTRCGNLTLGLVSVLILACPAIGLGQGKAGDLTVRPYVFQTLDKQTVDAEFGRLLVPENRRNPQSRLIELVFVRFKSTIAERRVLPSSILPAALAARASGRRGPPASHCSWRCASSGT